MTEQLAAEEPCFDIIVRVPPGASLDTLDSSARRAGIAPDRVDLLLATLRRVPTAKVGAGIPRSRALTAQAQFQAAGLDVTLTPVLTLQAKTAHVGDGMETCPACETRVLLGKERQCPACGVYVDKVTEEFLLQRKILQQERLRQSLLKEREARDAEQRIRDALEASLREKIRAELEAEYRGRPGARNGPRGVVLGAAALGLASLAFAGGHLATGRVPWLQPAAALQARAAPVDALLDRIAPKAPADATALAAAAHGAPPSGDPDVDDPLIQAAGGRRIGAKGLSVEQAVAAAQALQPATAMAAPGSAATAPAGTAPVAVAGREQTPALPPAERALLMAEFAMQLAELGQMARAQAVLTTLRAHPAAQELRVQAAIRLAGLETAAWAARDARDAAVRPAIEGLLRQAGGVPDATERALALVRAASILARHPQLPPEAPNTLLAQAVEAIKAAPEAQRAAAIDAWTVALGEVLAERAARQAAGGRASQAQATAAELAALANQAQPSVQAQLWALERLAWHAAGQPAQAAAAWDKALGRLAGEPGPARRAALLRSVGRLADGSEDDKMVAAATALQQAVESLQGQERMQALGELALFHADAGAPARAEQLARRAVATEGVEPASAAPMQAALLVRADLAAARQQHRTRDYAGSEQRIRRVVDYLF